MPPAAMPPAAMPPAGVAPQPASPSVHPDAGPPAANPDGGPPPVAVPAPRPVRGRRPPPRAPKAGAIVAVLVTIGVLTIVGAVGLAGLATRASSAAASDDPAGSPGPATPDAASSTTGSSSELPASPGRSATSRAGTPGGPQKVMRLADNPIFADTALPPVACQLPPLSTETSGQTAFFQAAVDCLNRSWLPVLAAARLPADPPTLVVPTEPYSTPCGNKSPIDNANYCEGVIYMPPRYFIEVERIRPNRPAVFLAVLAHEYGHHVQELSGVMDAAWERRYLAGVDSPAGLDVSRRNELSASCFGGMFFASVAGRGSISKGMLNQAQQDASRRGDDARSGLPRDHGTPRNNGEWFRLGVHQNHAVKCNTWQAPVERVS